MKIQNKLFLTLFSFSLVLVAVLVLLIQWSIGKGMVEYVNTKEAEAIKPLVNALVKEYQINEDWSTLKNNDKKFSDLVYLKLKDSGFIHPLPEFRRPPMDFRNSQNGNEFIPGFALRLDNEQMIAKEEEYNLLNSNKALVVGVIHEDIEYTNKEIKFKGNTVGFLSMPKRHEITDGYELDFIEQQQSYLGIIALITMMLVIVVTLPLARHVVGPINLLTLGMHRLTQGKYQQKIDSQRKDELGELSRDFNELAFTLDENENARKRWLANISHELRTPVAILRGELEAMLDNVRPLNNANIASANDEVKHLQYLIDDLQQLSSADIGGMSYRKKSIDVTAWIKSEANKYNGYLADAGIKLETQIDDKEALVFVDTTRLCQLFDNLINNCIKYSQASVVKISLEKNEDAAVPSIIITVEDNGVGVSEEHLPKLFEYLYRIDNSRNRKTGGTGLGLSICAHIVAAHQGNISAEASSLGGLAIIVDLPLIV